MYAFMVMVFMGVGEFVLFFMRVMSVKAQYVMWVVNNLVWNFL